MFKPGQFIFKFEQFLFHNFNFKCVVFSHQFVFLHLECGEMLGEGLFASVLLAHCQRCVVCFITVTRLTLSNKFKHFESDCKYEIA